MTTPAFEKTWIHQVVTLPGIADDNTQYRTLMLGVKNLLVSMGWVVTQSTRIPAALWQAGDLWTGQADLTSASGRYSYCVLRTPVGITPPWYIAITTVDPTSWGVYYYGYVGASDTPYGNGSWNVYPPNAAGEVPFVNQWGSASQRYWAAVNTSNTQFQLHGLRTDDYKHTRIFGCSAGKVNFTIFAEELAEAGSAYNPNFVGWSSSQSWAATSGNADLSNLYTYSPLAVSADTALETNAPGLASFTAEAIRTTGICHSFCTTVDPADSCWPLSPIGVWSDNPNHYGRRGRVKDMYWGSATNPIGTTYQSSIGGANGWVKMGGLIVPACGDVWALS